MLHKMFFFNLLILIYVIFNLSSKFSDIILRAFMMEAYIVVVLVTKFANILKFMMIAQVKRREIKIFCVPPTVSGMNIRSTPLFMVRALYLLHLI